MANWDMTKRQVNSDGKIISTGQKITPLFPAQDTSLKKQVDGVEKKLDELIQLISNKK